MVEEIRSYILNSPLYSGCVFFPQEYVVRQLPPAQALFRDLVLGLPSISDRRVHAWRAGVLVSGIYRDRQLSEIAREIFDARTLGSRSPTAPVLEGEPEMSVASKDPSLVIIPTTDTAFPSSLDKTLTLHKGAEPGSLEATVVAGQSSGKFILNFSFSENSSDLVEVPGLPVRVGFSGVGAVPENFEPTAVSFAYPYKFSVDGLIGGAAQIPGLDQVLWANKTASEKILPVYSGATRGYIRLLCLVLGYAVTVKEMP